MRQPRPKGATYLSMKQRETGNLDDQDQLYRHLITLYTTEGFRWNGIPTSIPEMSMILKIPQHHIMALVSETGTHMGSLASPENIKNTLQTIMTLSTSFALEDRGLIMKQLELLTTSQDGKYKPFISSEVAKTLKLALDSNKNITELYKTFFTSTSPTTNILNVFGEQEQANPEDTLTPDKAIQILNQDSNLRGLPGPSSDPASLPTHDAKDESLADTAELADNLYQAYGIGDFEDVRERRSGTDSLRAPEPKPGTSLPADTGPPSLPAEEDGGHRRRGIEVVDVDEIGDEE